LFAHRKQAVAGNVDAGIFHIHGGLLAAESGAGGNRHCLLLACRRDQLHFRIVPNQGNDLAEPCFRQVSNEVDSSVFETLNDSLR
jgi:hypothetical protein